VARSDWSPPIGTARHPRVRGCQADARPGVSRCLLPERHARRRRSQAQRRGVRSGVRAAIVFGGDV